MIQSLILGIGLLFGGVALADPQVTPTAEEADSLFQAESWAAAAAAYQALITANPRDGSAWFRLGYARYKQRDVQDAAKAWQQALDLHYYPTVSAYNIAAAKALQGDSEGAFTLLDKAIHLGFAEPEVLRTDPDFTSLRSDPRFARRIEQAEHNARPCMYDTRFRAFDFWVGDWVVRDAQGQKVGSDRVKQAENGCAITAQWTDHFGRTGTSLTWFDPRRGHWEQTRVGAAGTFVRAEGDLDDKGRMVLEGDLVVTKGDAHKVRTTWTPRSDGTLSMKVQRSDDGGRTWLTTFQGFYERRDLYGGE